MSSNLLRKLALAIVVAVTALTWTQSGRADHCIVARGQDPLEVLNVRVKHNVWFILDTSGSMDNDVNNNDVDPLPTESFKEDNPAAKLFIAKDELKRIMSELVDASGNPVVNWGLATFGTNGDVCDGGVCNGMLERVTVPECDGADPRPAIFDFLRLAKDGGVEASGFTPNGKALEQLGDLVDVGVSPTLLENQRSFFILVTDGEDTCENGSSFDDGTASASLLTCPGTPVGITAGACASSANRQDTRSYNAGLKGADNFLGADGVAGTQDDIDTFVIGFGLTGVSRTRTCNIAWQASNQQRAAFFTDPLDPLSLSKQLRQALALIGTPDAEVSFGPSIVGTIKELVAHPAGADPSLAATDFVAGGTSDFTVRNLRNFLRNNILLTTTVTTPGFEMSFKAFNVFRVLADDTRVADFGTFNGGEPIWDAGLELRTRDLAADPRRVFFSRAASGPDPVPFVAGVGGVLPLDLGVGAGYLMALDPTGVGAKTAADAVEIVVKTIRGWKLIIDPVMGFYEADGVTLAFEADTTDTPKLFDATNAAPAIVLNPPRSPGVDPPQPQVPYADFFEEHINRLTVVYLGTNGGMMHAFRGDTGRELYGYVPHDLLLRLKDFAANLVADNNGIENHQFFIAVSAFVADAFLQDAPTGEPEWRTVLSFGRGRGGNFVTALDITDVGEWLGTSDPVTPQPKLIFTVGNTHGVIDTDGTGNPEGDYEGFGETWSIGVLGRVNNGTLEGQWVMFIAGGYGCPGTEEGQFLYVLRLEDGTVVRKLGPIEDVVGPTDPGIDDNALVATPATYNPSVVTGGGGSDFETRVYIGDLQGFVYKLDATNTDPALWGFGVLFEVTSQADVGAGDHNQPITVQAAILRLAGTPNILIYLATGGDARVVLQEPDRFKIVGILDVDDTSAAFEGQLLQTDAGEPFFFDLPEGERVTASPVAARSPDLLEAGVVFFVSTRVEPVAITCTSAFFSTLTAVGATSGLGGFDLHPDDGVQGTVDLGEGKVTGLFHRDGHLYVSKSGGLGSASETLVLGADEFPAPPAGTLQLLVLVETFRYSPF